MFKTLKTAAAAAIVTIALPISAIAATITGQIDITGNVNLDNSSFNAAGNADLSPVGGVTIADGDFAAFVTPFVSTATLTDIDFTAPGVIWSVGGFTFTAAGFHSFVDAAQKAFTAVGTISGNGFDDTDGTLTFTSQVNGDAVNVSFSSTTVPVPVPAAGLLLLGALGGVGALRRRKKAA